VELLDDETRSVLLLVERAEQMGEPLTKAEFEPFAKGPKRTVQRAVAFSIIGPQESTEPVLSYVTRTRLVKVEADRVRLTRLAKMLLSEADAQAERASQPNDILLAADDEWATRDMIRVVKQAGAGMLVDPYCREVQLNELLRYTETSRVLVGPAVANEDFDLTLGRVRAPRQLEVRVSKDVHDRHVIPDYGPVMAFGASMNGVGRNKPTIVVRLSEAMSGPVRQTYNDLWEKAEPWIAAPAVEA